MATDDHPSLRARLDHILEPEERPPREMERLIRLMVLFARLDPPPDPMGLFPRYAALKKRFLDACKDADGACVEEAFLELYCHVHGHEAPYTPEERRRVDRAGGYWCHAGGLSPVLKSPDHLGPASVSADFGAGNGLQGLLMQKLKPHRKTVQIEISSKMVEAGRQLQAWLGIEPRRVAWRVMDVMDAAPEGMDFIYLYRPVRPDGEGRRFYRRFADALARSASEVVIFSIADCLREFLPGRFEVFYSDGHLTCFRTRTAQ